MQVTLQTLRSVLQENVVEIKFQRRRPKPGASPYRRMLCTNSYELLNSARGRTALNFKPTSSSPKYNPTSKNIVLTWDIFMQDYRAVSMDVCDMVTLLPANDSFWTYYEETLSNMSADEKMTFMSI